MLFFRVHVNSVVCNIKGEDIMRVSTINSYAQTNCVKSRVSKNHHNLSAKVIPTGQTGDVVTFKGPGRFLGTLLGGAAGGATGAAIIGGGSLAGAAALAALGPLGVAAVAVYAIGGTLAGGYVGEGFGRVIDEKNGNDD